MYRTDFHLSFAQYLCRFAAIMDLDKLSKVCCFIYIQAETLTFDDYENDDSNTDY